MPDSCINISVDAIGKSVKCIIKFCDPTIGKLHDNAMPIAYVQKVHRKIALAIYEIVSVAAVKSEKRLPHDRKDNQRCDQYQKQCKPKPSERKKISHGYQP